MKCLNCGSELPEEAKFCLNCGIKIKQNDIVENEGESLVVEETEIEEVEKIELIESNAQLNKEENKRVSFADKIKAKIRSAWECLPTFYKVSLISILGLVLLFLVAYFTDKIFAILCTVVQFVGIVAAMLLRKGIIKTDKKWLSYLVLIVAILLTALNVYSYFGNCALVGVIGNKPNAIITPDDNNNTYTTKSKSKTALLPFGDGECVGKKQEDIVKLLRDEGFNNISAKPISELEVEGLDRKGEIFKITVGGSEAFTKGTELDKTVAIEITYYDAKCIAVPINAKDAETKDTEELVSLFKNAGFLNVTVDIEKDIDPEYSQEAFRNEVSIDYDRSFDTTDTFPIDSKVTIISHRLMEKYKVKIDIDFISNFFFNKYSVDVELGYKELGTLSHGEDDTYELWLEPGKHEITFKKHSYKRPEKDVEFTIQGETEITYQITCYEDSIHVERTEFIDKGAVGEGKVMVPGSAQDFKYDNYKDVEKEFKDAGFTNIKTAILYDIVWGWTSEGEVDSVSIDGKSDFRNGDVFYENAEVIITYHLWQQDDPSLIKTPMAASEYEGLHFSNVEKIFRELGFSNVVLESSETTEEKYDNGEVYRITIDGEHFGADKAYKSDKKVVIKYYTRKITLEEVQTLINSCCGMTAEEVLAQLVDAEFTFIYSVDGVVADIVDPAGLFFKSGTIDSATKTINLNFTAEDPAAVQASLENFLPQETALRVAVVAMTNGAATDVFKKDGNTYDTSKFHKYSDISGFYLSVNKKGKWMAKDEKTWRVTGFVCRLSGYGTYLHASMDITYNGKNYVVSNVDKLISTKAVINTGDSEMGGFEHMEPSKSNAFLTVSPSLIKKDRDSEAEKKQNDKTMPTDTRKSWISGQFSIWNGEHTQLKKLIKKNLNDESSYKHIETKYQDVTSKEAADEINKILKKAGYSKKVKVGDLFIICEFSAKNGFNATVKNTAYAISRFDTKTIELIGIE